METETSFNPFDEKYNVSLAGEEERLLATLEAMQGQLSLYVSQTTQQEKTLRERVQQSHENTEKIITQVNQICELIADNKVAQLRKELVKKGVLEDE